MKLLPWNSVYTFTIDETEEEFQVFPQGLNGAGETKNKSLKSGQ